MLHSCTAQLNYLPSSHTASMCRSATFHQTCCHYTWPGLYFGLKYYILKGEVIVWLKLLQQLPDPDNVIIWRPHERIQMGIHREESGQVPCHINLQSSMKKNCFVYILCSKPSCPFLSCLFLYTLTSLLRRIIVLFLYISCTFPSLLTPFHQNLNRFKLFLS